MNNIPQNITAAATAVYTKTIEGVSSLDQKIQKVTHGRFNLLSAALTAVAAYVALSFTAHIIMLAAAAVVLHDVARTVYNIANGEEEVAAASRLKAVYSATKSTLKNAKLPTKEGFELSYHITQARAYTKGTLVADRILKLFAGEALRA